MNVLPENILKRMRPEDRKPLGKAGRTYEECTAQASIKLERELHKLISNELLRRGIFAVHSRTDKRTTNAVGVPDFIFAIGGRPIAVEVKMPKGVLSGEQLAVMNQMKATGWNYFVVRSFDDLRLVLDWFQSDASYAQPSQSSSPV